METKRAIWPGSEDHEGPGLEDSLMVDEDDGVETIHNIKLKSGDQDEVGGWSPMRYGSSFPLVQDHRRHGYTYSLCMSEDHCSRLDWRPFFACKHAGFSTFYVLAIALLHDSN